MYSIPGLTSKLTQKFINQLCSNSNSYLEIGSYLGATAVAALDGNKLDAYFVDNWKEDVQPMREDLEQLPPNSKDVFKENVKKWKGKNNINIFDCDMFNVDLSHIKPIDIFFYDAHHGEEYTSRAIQYFSKVFNETTILLIDDANFDTVVSGARDGIRKAGLSVLYEKMILNDIEDPDAWWNGLYIIIIRKNDGNIIK